MLGGDDDNTFGWWRGDDGEIVGRAGGTWGSVAKSVRYERGSKEIIAMKRIGNEEARTPDGFNFG